MTGREFHVTGSDGKRYPGRYLPKEDRDYLFGRSHYLKHDHGLSVRQIREQLLYDHGITRSVGSIAAYLARPCEECSGGQKYAPEQSGGAA